MSPTTSIKPVILVIMDGVGIGSGGPEDAVSLANTPHLDWLRQHHPHMVLAAHGLAVGLPNDTDMGNSEVGHNAMGAGAVYDQGAKLVHNAVIVSGKAFEGDVWQSLLGGTTLHLLGMISDGNVHSHVDHLTALIKAAHDGGVTRLRLHLLTDGRDVAPRSALTWVTPLEHTLDDYQRRGFDYAIGSGGGRMIITMDRYEADWAMVERGWRTHVLGDAPHTRRMSDEITRQYNQDADITDQTLQPFVVVDSDDQPIGVIDDGDSVLLFNFRGDRAIEICRAFEEDNLSTFDRQRRPNVTFAGMMLYDGDAMVPSRYLVAPPVIKNTVSENLAGAQRTSIAIAETQKFGHVTYFFNGNRSTPINPTLEAAIEIPSDNISFDQAPVMKAVEVTQSAVEAIVSGQYHHVRVNYANGDMVGHTGHLAATIRAVEAVDDALGKIIEATTTAQGILLVTADHGNADEMFIDKGGVRTVRTSHTLSPVPFCLYDPQKQWTLTHDKQSIAAIGATLLHLCDVAIPDHYLPSLVKPRA